MGRHAADPARGDARAAQADRARGADRGDRGPAARRRDRRRQRPARGDHLRRGRLLRLPGRPGRHQLRPADRLPRRHLALRPGPDRGRRAHGRHRRDRRPLPQLPGPRGLPGRLRPGRRDGLPRQVGDPPEPGGHRQHRVLAHPGRDRARRAAGRRLPGGRVGGQGRQRPRRDAGRRRPPAARRHRRQPGRAARTVREGGCTRNDPPDDPRRLHAGRQRDRLLRILAVPVGRPRVPHHGLLHPDREGARGRQVRLRLLRRPAGDARRLRRLGRRGRPLRRPAGQARPHRRPRRDHRRHLPDRRRRHLLDHLLPAVPRGPHLRHARPPLRRPRRVERGDLGQRLRGAELRPVGRHGPRPALRQGRRVPARPWPRSGTRGTTAR